MLSDHLDAAQCRMACAALQLGMRELTTATEVSLNTITRVERRETLYALTVNVICIALEAACVEFVKEKEGAPKRQRS